MALRRREVVPPASMPGADVGVLDRARSKLRVRQLLDERGLRRWPGPHDCGFRVAAKGGRLLDQRQERPAPNADLCLSKRDRLCFAVAMIDPQADAEVDLIHAPQERFDAHPILVEEAIQDRTVPRLRVRCVREGRASPHAGCRGLRIVHASDIGLGRTRRRAVRSEKLGREPRRSPRVGRLEVFHEDVVKREGRPQQGTSSSLLGVGPNPSFLGTVTRRRCGRCVIAAWRVHL
mmetsp:Transcript_14197/g.53344  ORF Transcript_14197/g.53344 Transcript_14197/m.53344 type:complete len:234 (+) Transcript_14197:452-1153(+)